MDELDAKIREALAQEDNALEEATRTEAGAWELFFSTMKGRNRFLGWLVSFWIFVFYRLGNINHVNVFFIVEKVIFT